MSAIRDAQAARIWKMIKRDLDGLAALCNDGDSSTDKIHRFIDLTEEYTQKVEEESLLKSDPT